MSLSSFTYSVMQKLKTALQVTPRFENSTHTKAQEVKVQFLIPNSDVAYLFIDDAWVDTGRFASTIATDPANTVVVKLDPGEHVLRVRGYGQPDQNVTIGISAPEGCKWKPNPAWTCRQSDGFINMPYSFTVA